MYRVYTNSMPPQFRPHFLPDFLPWLAERLEKRNQRLGEFCFSSQFFVADQKLVGHRVFYSFYYLTISRWLFPFQSFFFVCGVLPPRLPPSEFVSSLEVKSVCAAASPSSSWHDGQFPHDKKKTKKTRGCSSEESSPLPDEKKKEKAMVQLPPFSKAVSQQSNDLHPLPVFSVFTLHVCPLSPYKALCDEPV